MMGLLKTINLSVKHAVANAKRAQCKVIIVRYAKVSHIIKYLQIVPVDQDMLGTTIPLNAKVILSFYVKHAIQLASLVSDSILQLACHVIQD